jgi:hypothetical protein
MLVRTILIFAMMLTFLTLTCIFGGCTSLKENFYDELGSADSLPMDDSMVGNVVRASRVKTAETAAGTAGGTAGTAGGMAGTAGAGPVPPRQADTGGDVTAFSSGAEQFEAFAADVGSMRDSKNAQAVVQSAMSIQGAGAPQHPGAHSHPPTRGAHSRTPAATVPGVGPTVEAFDGDSFAAY